MDLETFNELFTELDGPVIVGDPKLSEARIDKQKLPVLLSTVPSNMKHPFVKLSHVNKNKVWFPVGLGADKEKGTGIGDKELDEYFGKNPATNVVATSTNRKDVDVELDEYSSDDRDDKDLMYIGSFLNDRPQLVCKKEKIVETMSQNEYCVVRTAPTYANIKQDRRPLAFDCDNNPRSRDKCMTKNAVMARNNRMKKKSAMNDLENESNKLKNENKQLKENVTKMEGNMKALEEEVEYLNSVIANQTSLSSLLRNIHNSKEMTFSSSAMLSHDTQASKPAKRSINCVTPDSDDEDEASTVSAQQINETNNNDWKQQNDVKARKALKTDHSYQKCVDNSDNNSAQKAHHISSVSGPRAGICLHVSEGKVSLEFCSQCSKKASKAFGDLTPACN